MTEVYAAGKRSLNEYSPDGGGPDTHKIAH